MKKLWRIVKLVFSPVFKVVYFFARFAKLIAFTILAAVSALAIAIASIDPNEYKGDIIAAIERATGREVAIDGALSWRVLSLSPGVSIENFSIKNASWGEAENLLFAKEMVASVSLRDLIMDRRVSIDTVRIMEPEVNLEVSRRGRKNWVPTKPREKQAEPGSVKVGVEALDIKRARIRFKNNMAGTKMEFALHDLKMRAAEGRPVRVLMEAESWGVRHTSDFRFTFEGEDMPFEGKAAFNNATIAASGIIKGYERDDRGVEAKIRLATPNIGKALAGIAEFDSDRPFALEAEGKMSNMLLSVPMFEAKLHTFSLHGSIEADFKGAKPNVVAHLYSPLFDIPDVFFPAYQERYRKWRATGEDAPSDKDRTPLPSDFKAFSDIPLPVAEFNLLNAKVELKIDKLKAMPEMEIDDISASLIVSNGRAVAAPLTARMAGGTVEVQAAANNAGGTFNFEAKARVDGVNVGKIIDSTGYAGVFEGGTARGEAVAKSSGNDLATFMANLDGNVKAWTTSKARGYRIEKLFMAEDVFLSVLRVVVGRSGSASESDIACVVANVGVKKGVATSNRGLAIQTKAANIVIDGKVDFMRETMDVSIISMVKESIAKDMIAISSGLTDLVKIEGEMSRPRITLSSRGAAGSIAKTALATALLGVATGGVSIAVAGAGFLTQSVLSNMEKDSEPCITALEGTASPRVEEDFIDRIMLKESVVENVANEAEALDSETTGKIERAKKR